MPNTQNSAIKSLRRALLTSTAICALAIAVPEGAVAQTIETPPGVYLELGGTYAFSLSDFDIGLGPVAPYPSVSTDDGDGWSGEITVGNKWANGMHAAMRFTYTDLDDNKASPNGIYVYNPIIGFFTAPNMNTEVDAEYHALEFEAGMEFGLGSGRMQVFGGLQYVGVERDVTTSSTLLAGTHNVESKFTGYGPFVGVRGGMPVGSGITAVGGAKFGVLYGEAEYKTNFTYAGVTYYPFKDGDHRVAGTINLEAGLAFQVGPGSVTLGYRFDALYGALDMDARVAAYYAPYRFGDSTDEFVTHGPFLRGTVPLGNVLP